MKMTENQTESSISRYLLLNSTKRSLRVCFTSNPSSYLSPCQLLSIQSTWHQQLSYVEIIFMPTRCSPSLENTIGMSPDPAVVSAPFELHITNEVLTYSIHIETLACVYEVVLLACHWLYRQRSSREWRAACAIHINP